MTAPLEPCHLWRPRPDVHVAMVEDDLVLLDVSADRYLCLPDTRGETTFSREGGLLIRDGELAADLAEAGLLERGSEAKPVLAPPPPRRTAIPERPGHARAVDLPEMLGRLNDALRCYRARGLADLLETARRSRPAEPRLDMDGVLEAAARFQRWLPYAPIPSKCLLRSFLLLRLLHRRGLDADWVFGVATWPFRAHCWLQAGDLALDDFPERLRAFTPILVA